jgi:hypothetical protein
MTDTLKLSEWPCRPPLIEGESFSSWLARFAKANALKPVQLCRLIDSTGYRAVRDLDRHTDVPLINRMAEAARMGSAEVEAATFRRWAGVTYENDDGRTKLEWTPPAGRSGGVRCFGQQLCPMCLSSDAFPYLRLNWRLSFFTACPVHAVILLDRCPACGEPFQALKCFGSADFRCWACGADPASASTHPNPAELLEVQRDLSAMVSNGWYDLGTYGPVFTFVALKILGLLCRLLAGGSHALPLRRWAGDQMKISFSWLESIRQVRDHTILPPRDRAIIIAMGHYLLQQWPERFTSASHAVNLSSSHLRKRHNEQVPFAFRHAIDFHLKQRHETGGNDEAAAATRILEARGQEPTYRNIVALAGRKRVAFENEAQPSGSRDRWGEGRHWKLTGVSPQIRGAARAAAHNAGLNVAAWIEDLIRRELLGQHHG